MLGHAHSHEGPEAGHADAHPVEDHSHGDKHSHGHRHGRSRKSDRRRLILAAGITLFICAVEVVGGVLSGSLALLSDAGHMVSDALGEFLALFALYLADRPADPRRTFGHHRVEILMALLQGAILFALAGLVIWNAAGRLHTPPEIHTRLMLIVAAVGLLANVVCAVLLHGGHSLNIRGAYLHVIMDALSSVAVLIVGGVMAFHPGLGVLDPLLSIGIGLFIIYSAYRLSSEAVDVLLEAAPPHLPIAQVREALLSIPGVRHIHDLHLWTITSGMHALSAHLLIDVHGTHGQVLAAAREVLAERFDITHSTLQIETQEDHPCEHCS
jgi:cobalt-zinc-cadmium efflux system protein